MLRKLLLTLASAYHSVVSCLRILRFLRTHNSQTQLLYFSQVAWDDVWQRPQELALRLAAHCSTVYISPVQYHHLTALSLVSTPTELCREVTTPSGESLLVITPLFMSGTYKSQLIHRFNLFLLNRITAALTRHCILNHLLTDTPFLYPCIQRIAATRIVGAVHYDVIDDFTAFDWSPKWSVALDQQLMTNAKSVTTGTLSLQRERQQLRTDEVKFVPVGVNGEAFSKPQTAPPEDLQPYLSKPIIGYIGSITDRIDEELLCAVADKCPDATVLLIGPVRLPNIHLLQSKHNIILLGGRPHHQLPAYLHHFCVGLIPFRMTAAAMKLFPVKTMEYMTAGVPVVSVALPDMVEYFADYVDIAHNSEDFINRVSHFTTHAINPVARDKARTFALSHTWGTMADSIMKAMAGFNK